MTIAVDEVRIWSVYNRDDRLVLALSEEPGEFNFTRIPEDGTDIVTCPFATMQCYLTEVEPDVLNHMKRARNLNDFLRRLRKQGYKVIDGRPQPSKFARL